MTTDKPGSLFSRAGWAAIASGAIGLPAFVSLVRFVGQRSTNPDAGAGLIRLHDGGVILQFLLLIPAIVALRCLCQQRSPGPSRAMFVSGIGAISFTILLLLLNFPHIVWDALYMFPQGVFGGWLMVVNWRMAGLLPGWLRWFGIVVALGLVLVGLFPLGYAVLIDSVCLRIPVVIDDFPTEFTPTNALLHRLLAIGSCLGVATLPIWSALLGWRLLRANRNRIVRPQLRAPVTRSNQNVHLQ